MITIGDVSAKKTFDNILAKADEKKIPVWAHVDITYKCNLRCVHCYCQGLSEEFSRGRDEMTLAQIKGLLDGLAEAGSLYCTLSGGEILTRQDFFEIAEYARKKNFSLSLFTNGTLIDEDKAERLKGLAPRSVEMSIYGSTADIHDRITRKRGSFKKLLEAVRILKKKDLRVVLKSVIMKPNRHQAAEMEKLSYDLGADDYNFTIEIAPKNDGSRLSQKYQLAGEELNSILSEKAGSFAGGIDEYTSRPSRKPVCGTGSIGCYISPYGDVYPCSQLLVPMGNIRDNSFKDIWHAPSPLRKTLNSLKTYQDMSSCRTCEYIGGCKKCIGLAHLETGDMKKCYNMLRTISGIEYGLIKEKEGWHEKSKKVIQKTGT